jgi:DNA invertase Pin-like site-specific DNA recombinase
LTSRSNRCAKDGFPPSAPCQNCVRNRLAKRYAFDEFREDWASIRVGYARVSINDQNPELQLEALRRAECTKIFSEKASGARDDRPELARILTEILRAGDTLVVWKLDRLARSLKKLIATAEELERDGIGLVSLTESIDTTTPGGMLTFHVFGAITQFERALIRERTTAGLIEARRQGRKGGRPPAMRVGDITAARAMMKEGSLRRPCALLGDRHTVSRSG